MGRLKRNGKAPAQQGGWLLTFADLLLLLLTFFILLFAMKSLDRERFQAAFSFFIQDRPLEEGREGLLAGALSLHLRRELAKLPAGVGEALHLESREGRLRLRLETDGLFDRGAFHLRPQALPFLEALSGVLGPLGRRVLVQGYPDGALEGEASLSLALERALAVRRYLVEVGGMSPDSLALALDREAPLFYPETDSRKRAWNRRVSFLILEDGDLP